MTDYAVHRTIQLQ